MIKHIVILNLRADHDAPELMDIMAGLDALEIAGFENFAHGPNHDLEHKSPNHPYGFICTFTDLDGLRRYASDPAHHALGARLIAQCTSGADGIMVMDLEV